MEELLSCKTLNLYIILGLSKALEDEYDYAISCFYDEMENSFYKGIIDTINKCLNIFCKKATPIFKLIEEIKNGQRKIQQTHR